MIANQGLGVIVFGVSVPSAGFVTRSPIGSWGNASVVEKNSGVISTDGRPRLTQIARLTEK